MSAAHTQGRITFKEDGDANHYSMLTEDGRWWLAVLANGEQTSERQVANFRRLAACWNACDGIPTEKLEKAAGDRSPVFALLMETSAQRDALLSALTALVANQDVTWRHADFTEDQIQAMPYLRPARDAIAACVVPS